MKQGKFPESIKEVSEKLDLRSNALRRRADECQWRITTDMHKRVKNIQIIQGGNNDLLDAGMKIIGTGLKTMEGKLLEQDEKLTKQTQLMKSTEKQLAVQNKYLEFLSSSLVEAKCTTVHLNHKTRLI